MEWLRHAPAQRAAEEPRTPLPLVRLRHLLNVVEQNPGLREQLHGMLAAFWRDIDAVALFADFGFGARMSLVSEIAARLRRSVLPATPQTNDLAELFGLLFAPEDGEWLAAIDDATLGRIAALLATPEGAWRGAMLDAITILCGAVHASGSGGALRQRMDRRLLANEPFRQLAASAEALRRVLRDGGAGAQPPEAMREALLLRALLDACRQAAASVAAHLEAFGISVDIVYELDQLDARTRRIELLLDCLLASEARPELLRLVRELVHVVGQQQGMRTVLGAHYSMLARQVAERNAETGEHYITRDRSEYRTMFRRAAGGGAVIAGTTFVKFALGALGFTAFWGGFWAGVNYAASFVLVMLLHWTVATKQPAMTAPALAASLPRGDAPDASALEAFVDRVVQLIRSQAASVAGNLAACAPLVLAVQMLAQALGGAPLVGEPDARYVLESVTLLGPTALYAAFTGVLLFASSLFAGWVENWFVFHRLDSAIAWNPRIVARLGAARAQRWADWWRRHISGLAANVSLGLMLGLVPALLVFFALPIEVRHVTLATGQLAAALGALGPALLLEVDFWWCVAGIAATGVLNVAVSFWLAFRVALRSRGVQVRERGRIASAIRRRLRQAPLSFVWPRA